MNSGNSSMPASWRRRFDRARLTIRRRLFANAVILTYHRVANESLDPLLLAVAPDRFREQLDVLRRKAHVLSLRSLTEHLRSGSVPRRGVVITFDDGYVDILKNALPLLRASGIPATVFATANFGGRFWWDQLADIVFAADADAAVASLAEALLPEGTGNAVDRSTLYGRLHRRLRRAPEPERARLSALAPPPEPRSLRRIMSENELHELGDDALVEIGAHTLSHPVLADLAPDRQQEEIVGSKRALERVLGKPVNSFAYPYGGWADYDAASIVSVQEAGFDVCCTMYRDTVWRRTSPLALPRYHVNNVGADSFEEFLEGCFIS